MADESQARTIEGWITAEIVDRDGDKIPIGEFEKAMPAYMARGGLIFDRHRKPVGRVMEWRKGTNPHVNAPGIFVKGQIFSHSKIDDEAWDLIKSGQYQMFSIGGHSRQNSIKQDGGRVFNDARDVEMWETSVVPKGKNDGAFITGYNRLAKEDSGDSTFALVLEKGDSMVCPVHGGVSIATKADCMCGKGQTPMNPNPMMKERVGLGPEGMSGDQGSPASAPEAGREPKVDGGKQASQAEGSGLKWREELAAIESFLSKGSKESEHTAQSGDGGSAEHVYLQKEVIAVLKAARALIKGEYGKDDKKDKKPDGEKPKEKAPGDGKKDESPGGEKKDEGGSVGEKKEGSKDGGQGSEKGGEEKKEEPMKHVEKVDQFGYLPKPKLEQLLDNVIDKLEKKDQSMQQMQAPMMPGVPPMQPGQQGQQPNGPKPGPEEPEAPGVKPGDEKEKPFGADKGAPEDKVKKEAPAKEDKQLQKENITMADEVKSLTKEEIAKLVGDAVKAQIKELGLSSVSTPAPAVTPAAVPAPKTKTLSKEETNSAIYKVAKSAKYDVLTQEVNALADNYDDPRPATRGKKV